jgi:hypothetical protein
MKSSDSTMDTITLARIELLHPKLRAEAKEIYIAIFTRNVPI